MARTVVAIFDNFQIANSAVRELVDHGFSRDKISIIANNTRGEYSVHHTDSTVTTTPVADETGAGAGVGAGIGAAIGGVGGLLVGLGALVIPGIGPVLAAGPLAVALSTLTGVGVGAVAGGVTGGLLGALIGLGIPEEEAGYYAEGVRRGGVLVTVTADEYNVDQITDILNRHDPIDIKERASQWRGQGWSEFDPKAGPYPSENASVSQADLQIANTGSRMEMNTSSAGMAALDREFNRDSNYYRTHYNTYLADSGYPYDYYLPAYEFGYGLRSDMRYTGRNWLDVENDIHRDWDRTHPGTWERFKASVRHAWEEMTD